ncbi:MAG TPA: hypothetical protein VG077_07395 [Verrucomicrobiae bacterium]|nr:hypothetical protein [Verrucomicrobiae bacterium]
MAWLDARNCVWVLEHCEDVSADIKRAALTPFVTSVLNAGDLTGEMGCICQGCASKGYKYHDLVNAVDGDGFSWSGDMSNYYQQWVDRFEKLKNTGDPDLQQIGEIGLKRAISQRDACLHSEQRERIIGWD